jgi:hypothetical protein
MTAEAPIDLDSLKVEDDIYGPQIKIEKHYESDPESEIAFKRAGRRVNPRYFRPSHKRHHEDADIEDRVLINLIDGGLSWELTSLTVLSD